MEQSLEKLTVTHLAKKFSPFMESEVSLMCSLESAIDPYSEPVESSQYLPTLFP